MYKRKIKYTTVSISEELKKEIDKHINTYDYVSVADFIRIAVKEKMKVDNLTEDSTIEESILHKAKPKSIETKIDEINNKLKKLLEKQK